MELRVNRHPEKFTTYRYPKNGTTRENVFTTNYYRTRETDSFTPPDFVEEIRVIPPYPHPYDTDKTSNVKSRSFTIRLYKKRKERDGR